MKRLYALTAIVAVALLAVGPASGRILSDGTDTELGSTGSSPSGLTVQGGCNVLWYGNSSGGTEVPRLAGLGLSITQAASSAELAIANLVNYDVLVVAYTPAGSITAYQPDIQMFVDMGRGLLLHQPNFTGTTDYAPTGFDADLSAIWCNGGTVEQAVITDGSHAIMSGLTDVDLAGDFDTVNSLGAGYSVLARNAVCNDPAVAAGTYGLGRVVLETGNASPTSLDPGSDAYWVNVFDWLCSPGPVSTEESSWGGIKATYR
jgi:hypothetical protein